MESDHSQPPPPPLGIPWKVCRATSLLFLGRQWGAVCTALILAVLAHELPISGFGRFTFYLAVFAFFDGFVDFGTGTVTLQRGTSNEEHFLAALGAARRVRAVTASCAGLFLGTCVLHWAEGGAAWIALAGFYPLTRVFEASALCFQRSIAHGVPVLVRSLSATLRLVSICGLALGGVHSVPLLLLVHASWIAAANLVLHRLARRHLPRIGDSTIPLDTPRLATLTLLRTAFPLALAGMFQQAYFYVDNLFVRSLLGLEELGLYNAAARIFSWLVLVAAYATSAALPWLVRRHEAGGLRAATARLGLCLSGIGVLAVAPLWLHDETILVSVFGNAYAGSATSLRWLLGAAICVFAGSGFLTAIIAAGKNWTAAMIALAALIVNVIGNLLWIPHMGIEGAAAATFASECTVCITSILILQRHV
ncbi:MAG: hypothetical protein CMJ89_10885 [Planctomycetes bacterium]|nr:hypothetical protein [Planctomycetota bacterium]